MAVVKSFVRSFYVCGTRVRRITLPKKEDDMGNMKDRYVRFDWAIKRLLRQKANFGVLEGFLTVFIGEPITILEILEHHHRNPKHS